MGVEHRPSRVSLFRASGKKETRSIKPPTTLARQEFQSVPTGGNREKNIPNGLDGCFYPTPRKGQFSLQAKAARRRPQETHSQAGLEIADKAILRPF